MSDPPDKLVGHLQRVSALCDLQRFDEAISHLDTILAAEPQSATAWSLRSRAELGRGAHEDALLAAKHAIALTPQSGWPHRLASIAHGRAGAHQEALWHAREAARAEPLEWRSFTTLARALLHDPKNRDEARGAAQRGLQLAPNETETNMVAGAVAAAARRPDDAEAAYRRVLAIDPQNAVAHNELARLKMPKGRFASPSGLAQAATGFATAVRADPRRTVSRLNLELVLRSFLSRVAYLIFLDAFLVSQLTTSSSAGAARFLLGLALAIPTLFAARFLLNVTTPIRQRLLAIVLRDARITPAVVFLAASIGLLVASALPTAGARTGLAGGAAALSLVGRLMLLTQVTKHSHAARGLKPRPAFSTPTLWLIATALAAAAVSLAYATATAKITGIGGTSATLVAAAASAAIVACIIRRRRSQG
jgi:tetratricopeptide (TPR) repeat protein